MDEYIFEDALAHSTVACTYPDLQATRVVHAASSAAQTGIAGDATVDPGKGGTGRTIFFPGCSFINYGLPLVQSVYDLLLEAGRVDGISLLCCGKILEYEGDGGEARAAFEEQLRQHIVQAGITRIIAACPNCVGALRPLLAKDPTTAQVEVVILPAVLLNMGYRVDAQVAREMLRDDPRTGADAPALFCVKDSCPDRATGEFADALRALLPDGMWVDPEHDRSRSICCGSRPRATGNGEAALTCTRKNADEAQEAGAAALASVCMSCTFLLSFLQRDLPVFHYLELLFNWRIDWDAADQYMKLRFLFDDALGAVDGSGEAQRGFKGIAS